MPKEQSLLRRAADQLDSAAMYAAFPDPPRMLVITPEAGKALAQLLDFFDRRYPPDSTCAEHGLARRFAQTFLGETDNENSGDKEQQ